jgi:pimeloyl-ACP methyl ester carboxylesterase
LLYGAQDAYCPEEERGRLESSLPGLRVTALPGAGHLQGYKRDPEKFMRAVRELFSKDVALWPGGALPVMN